MTAQRDVTCIVCGLHVTEPNPICISVEGQEEGERFYWCIKCLYDGKCNVQVQQEPNKVHVYVNSIHITSMLYIPVKG
jgi:hypothetical protein